MNAQNGIPAVFQSWSETLKSPEGVREALTLAADTVRALLRDRDKALKAAADLRRLHGQFQRQRDSAREQRNAALVVLRELINARDTGLAGSEAHWWERARQLTRTEP